MKKHCLTVPIRGMHCRSCEILIGDKLSEIPEVSKAEVSYKNHKAHIYYDQQKPKMSEVEQAIQEAGYSIGNPDKKTWLSKNPRDYKDLGIAFLFLFGAYLLLKETGLLNINISSGSNPSSIPIVLLIGLTAGFSTCMALVGGLILGLSARHAERHPEATVMQKFRPHLFFNFGRIASYVVLGGLLGAVGSVLQLSTITLGILTLVIGVVMLLLGAKLVGIFPKLDDVSITLPSSISKFLGIERHEKEYNHRGAAVLGALTFFLPCGFTQAMQLYAMSSGSFTKGALIMGVFALGTAPGLLGIGGISSAVKGVFAQRFFKFAGVVVILFALFNISNGYHLTGFNAGLADSNETTAADPNVTMENGVQIVRMTETARGYSPNKFTIQKGIPVRWIIDAQDSYSCASSLVSSALNVQKRLVAGENIIEFTPTETGKIAFSCSMGMYRGSFEVVNPASQTNNVQPTSNQVDSNSNSAIASGQQGGSCGNAQKSGGCGCGGGSGSCGAGSNVSAEKIQGVTQQQDSADIQLIKTAYTYNTDIQPNTFTVQSGKPVRFEIEAKENGSGCMSTIMIPTLYNTPELLEKGKTVAMNFTPTQPGTYEITCAMGVPRGTITVL
ncbi:MAG: sulfite exporter TauE/SafE family protein [Candidatus Kerfeldbacteria bacterium]|nr:sulfite exporter TauE/SafE family protein [Candidatus Kerfeldbacteria bacterium]